MENKYVCRWETRTRNGPVVRECRSARLFSYNAGFLSLACLRALFFGHGAFIYLCCFRVRVCTMDIHAGIGESRHWRALRLRDIRARRGRHPFTGAGPRRRDCGSSSMLSIICRYWDHTCRTRQFAELKLMPIPTHRTQRHASGCAPSASARTRRSTPLSVPRRAAALENAV